MAMSEKRHILFDVWVDSADILTHVATWQTLLRSAALAGDATILGEQFHQFEPVGVTGLLLLAESHISVHTWPEEKFAAIDIFTCGKLDAERVVAYLEAAIRPIQQAVTITPRGGLPNVQPV